MKFVELYSLSVSQSTNFPWAMCHNNIINMVLNIGMFCQYHIWFWVFRNNIKPFNIDTDIANIFVNIFNKPLAKTDKDSQIKTYQILGQLRILHI